MHHPVFSRRPWLQPLHLPSEPVGMLGPGEAAMFYAMAKEVFSGRGTIVDAGSFLGKSAFFLASGLRANPAFAAGRDRVHCFDLFQVNHGSTIDFIRDKMGQVVHMGESTRATFERQVAPVRDLLEVHEGDLHAMPWQRQPVEILMVDIAKSPSLGSRVIDLFFRDLVPGVSYVIHQDYHHPWHPHIHVVMSYLADYFDVVAPRVDSSTTFCCKKAIPEDVLLRAIRYDFSAAEKTQLMDAALSRLPVADRPIVELARIVLCGESGASDKVLADIEALAGKYSHLHRDAVWTWNFDQVRDHFLESDGWQQRWNRRFDISLKRAEELLARKSGSGSLQRLRGASLMGLGRLDEGERVLRQSLLANPPSGFAYIDLAEALAAQGRHDEAEAEIVRGLNDPQAVDADPHYYFESLGRILQQHARVDRAGAVMARLRAALADASLAKKAELWALDARLQLHLGNRQQALASLKTAVECGLTAARQAELSSQLGIAREDWCR